MRLDSKPIPDYESDALPMSYMTVCDMHEQTMLNYTFVKKRTFLSV